jgi:hypothetical protein
LPGRPEKIQGSLAHEIDVQAVADRIVLKNHSPADVVMNRAMEVVHFRGRTAPYLEAAPVKPSMNVLKLARNGLALELRTLIGAVLKKDAPAQREGVSFNGDGHSRTLNLSVTPLGEKGSICCFVNTHRTMRPVWPGSAGSRRVSRRFARSPRESGCRGLSNGLHYQRKTRKGFAQLA